MSTSASTASRQYLWDAVVVLAVIVLGLAGYRLAPLLSAEGDQRLPPLNCDLNQGACREALPDGGEVVIDITPHPIPTVAPLALSVRLTDRAADQVSLDFAGVTMQMGYNRTELREVSAPGGTDDRRTREYRGQGSLPVCITGTMDWEATVLLTQGGKTLAVPFRFQTGSP